MIIHASAHRYFGWIVGALLAIPAMAQLPVAATGPIEGIVTGSKSGSVLPGAMVTDIQSGQVLRTDPNGRFVFHDMLVGTHVIRVQSIGYKVAEYLLTLDAKNAFLLDAKLDALVSALDTVRVSAKNSLGKPERLANTDKYDEFYERRKIGGGGYLMTHEDLEKKVHSSIVDAFRSIPRLMLVQNAGRWQIRIPGCPQEGIAVFIDNQMVYPPPEAKAGGGIRPLQPPSNPMITSEARSSEILPLDLVADLGLDSIEAVEVYVGPSAMPAIARGNACAAIFIWRR